MPRVAVHSRRAPGSSPDQIVRFFPPSYSQSCTNPVQSLQIDGTYGPIDGPRLLETLPRGYTPRKESVRQRCALPDA
jgi:hypothetical protein